MLSSVDTAPEAVSTTPVSSQPVRKYRTPSGSHRLTIGAVSVWSPRRSAYVTVIPLARSTPAMLPEHRQRQSRHGATASSASAWPSLRQGREVSPRQYSTTVTLQPKAWAMRAHSIPITPPPITHFLPLLPPPSPPLPTFPSSLPTAITTSSEGSSVRRRNSSLVIASSAPGTRSRAGREPEAIIIRFAACSNVPRPLPCRQKLYVHHHILQSRRLSTFLRLFRNEATTSSLRADATE